MIGFYGGGGAIILFQVFCIVHAVRHDRASWIWIILFFPLIGSLAYLVTEVRGVGGLGRGGRRLAVQIADVVQPSRRLEALRAAVDSCPSVENRLQLAEECVRLKLYDEALRNYDAASTGAHKGDPEVLRGRATAQFEMGAFKDAQATLEHLQAVTPRECSPAIRLLYARVVEATGDLSAALAAYEAACASALGDEARCRHATVLERAGRREDALAIYRRIVKEAERAPGYYRRDNREWIRTASAKLQEPSASPPSPSPSL